MALIDQRILIPAPMSTVWEILADHTTLSQWRSDCRAVSILSTHHVGQGVRRRISPQRGKDFLEDFKAWYNGFGYEYQVVDSKTYKYNLSRVRLQATPDGTIVQWTIEFDAKGFWAQLLGGRRRRYVLEKTVVESLRELRRYVVSKGVPLDSEYRTKASVQDAPDVQKRAAYGAQLFSQVEATEQVEDATGSHKPVIISASESPIIQEPPVRVEDTPSIPTAPPPSFITSQFDVKTPSPDSVTVDEEETTSAEVTSDTQPNAPIIVPDVTDSVSIEVSLVVETEAIATPEIAPTPTESPSESVDAKQEAPKTDKVKSSAPVEMKPPSFAAVEDKEASQPAHPAVMSAPSAPIENTQPEEKPVTVINKQFMEDTRAKTKPKPPEGLAEAAAKSNPVGRETDQMSIWDVFGVARPTDLDSQNQLAVPVETSEKASTPQQMTASTQPSPAKSVVEMPGVTDTSELDTIQQTREKKQLSLDELLAMEEPPLPASASASVNTIVRQSSQSIKTMGLRKQQSRKIAPVRSGQATTKPNKDG